MKKITAFILFFLPFLSFAESVRIDPAYWWVGMKNTRVELMVHFSGVGNSTGIKIEHEGVVAEKLESLSNPNYLFVTLNIAPDTKPGKFLIYFNNPKGEILGEFELKERNAKQDVLWQKSVDNSDFIYLIMPDRFANGNPANDVVKTMNQTNINRAEMFERHGGDLLGIIKHLDYLIALNVTALWLNPVFENDQPSASYHGYAITDHYKVDARLGNNNLYGEFVETCHKKGLKVIKDVIYNHVGNQHYFIKDLPSDDWIHQWAEGFTRTTYREPVLMDPYVSEADKKQMTDGWFDTHMPDLNQRNPHVANYLIQNTIWWVETYGLNGLRIDTYAYPDQEFMSNLCTAVLNEYPDFCIFAETWVHGNSVQSFFTESNVNFNLKSTCPAVTDFQLYFAVSEALTREQGWTEGAARLYYATAKDFLYKHPYKNVTFLDNHDLSRFYSVVGENFDKYKQGMAWLACVRGIPSIYYGTEILLKNFANPDGLVRQDFPGGWAGDTEDKFEEKGRNEKEQQAFEFVSKLFEYRKNNQVLQTGKMMQFVPIEGVYTFFRYNDEKAVMVIINTSKEERTVDMNRFKERTNKYNTVTDIISQKILSRNTIENSYKIKGNELLLIELEIK